MPWALQKMYWMQKVSQQDDLLRFTKWFQTRTHEIIRQNEWQENSHLRNWIAVSCWPVPAGKKPLQGTWHKWFLAEAKDLAATLAFPGHSTWISTNTWQTEGISLAYLKSSIQSFLQLTCTNWWFGLLWMWPQSSLKLHNTYTRTLCRCKNFPVFFSIIFNRYQQYGLWSQSPIMSTSQGQQTIELIQKQFIGMGTWTWTWTKKGKKKTDKREQSKDKMTTSL